MPSVVCFDAISVDDDATLIVVPHFVYFDRPDLDCVTT